MYIYIINLSNKINFIPELKQYLQNIIAPLKKIYECDRRRLGAELWAIALSTGRCHKEISRRLMKNKIRS